MGKTIVIVAGGWKVNKKNSTVKGVGELHKLFSPSMPTV